MCVCLFRQSFVQIISLQPEDVIPGPVEQNSLASTLNTEVVSSIQHLSRDSSVVLPHSNKKDQPVMMKDQPVHPTESSIKPQSLSQERGRRRRWEGTRYWTTLWLYVGSSFKSILQGCLSWGSSTAGHIYPFVTFLASFWQAKTREEARFTEILHDALNNCSDLLKNHGRKEHKIWANSLKNHLC